MKFCRFVPLDRADSNGAPRYGILDEYQVREISGAPWLEWAQAPRAWPLASIRLAGPVEPTKIVCIGRNYAAHAAELGNEVPREPLIFLKPPSSLIGDGESIRLPTVSKQVEYEGEIGVVVSQTLRRASRDQAGGAIAGIVAANDVTARDL